MKLLKTIVAAGMLCAFTIAVSAQVNSGLPTQPGPNTSARSGSTFTNRIAGSTSITNLTSSVIDATGGRYLVLEWNFQMAAGGTTNQTMWVGRSVDRNPTNAETFLVWSVAANGTGVASGSTNVDIGAYPYIFIQNLTNAFATGTHYMTNVTVYSNVKQ